MWRFIPSTVYGLNRKTYYYGYVMGCLKFETSNSNTLWNTNFIKKLNYLIFEPSQVFINIKRCWENIYKNFYVKQTKQKKVSSNKYIKNNNMYSRIDEEIDL